MKQEIEEIRYYADTLCEIAEDCQLARGVNSPRQLTPWLKAYPLYSDCINALPDGTADHCVRMGFLKAEENQSTED